MKQRKHQMTSGRILPQLLFFALPLLGSSLIQQLYNTADLFFVGQFAGKNAAAAVGSSGLIFTCLIGLFTGISVGVGIVIAQALGGGREKDANKTAHTAMTVGLIGSFLLMMVGIVFAETLLIQMNTPSEILKDAVIYVRIYFLSMIPMVLYNMGSSILRASGNASVPLYILMVGGVANVVADYILVVLIPLGVVGVGIATSISQTCTAIGICWYLCKKEHLLNISLQKLKLDTKALAAILKYGLPAGVQSIVLTFSNVMVQYCINGYGEDAVAAYAAYFKIENFVYLPIMACGQAITTFVGQNYGAGNVRRIKKGTFFSLLFSTGCTLLLAGGLLLFPEKLVGLFIADSEVMTLGTAILKVTFPFYFLYAILEVTGGALRGMGYTQLSMIVVMSGLCVLRIVLLGYVQQAQLPFTAVATVYPVTWAVTAASFCVLFLWKIRRK